ncbi:hypothetical protein [Paenibacillus sabinae]|uniref:Uncharacterized protein n=1 Tax=Paenibacillus sabinae T27 TaxID=1268072 RepID=X4ZJF3_9BACL|nr:hypothetical protein [Paenibacillus sabinae]AHV97447.1 hypothetical protein PSAB_12645 [Paenibacillus sabinae T27]
MNGLFKVTGVIIIVLVILYIAKKVSAYLNLVKPTISGGYEDNAVYQAAQKFAQGVSHDEIRDILLGSYEFDQQRIEMILRLALPHRTDGDGGYRAFIEAVNQVLGEEIYH